jgi:hypothetical protein
MVIGSNSLVDGYGEDTNQAKKAIGSTQQFSNSTIQQFNNPVTD